MSGHLNSVVTINLIDVMKKFLKEHPEQKYTSTEIAKWIYDSYPDYIAKRTQRSAPKNRSRDLYTEEGWISQLSAEIGSKNPQIEKQENIRIIATRPKQYYYSALNREADVEKVEQKNIVTPASFSGAARANTVSFSEHDLYPKLASFLHSAFNVYPQRIDERKSSNSYGSGGNKWLFPDLVGLEDLTKDWCREIKDCVKQYADKKSKLWSFEVKIRINRSNVRESFFQAVSNSSWANFGYLVASEIEDDALKELRILSALHGIGYIRLNLENEFESEIIIPANERNEIDWNSANRLADQNADFKEFVTLIRNFYLTDSLKKSDWYIPKTG